MRSRRIRHGPCESESHARRFGTLNSILNPASGNHRSMVLSTGSSQIPSNAEGSDTSAVTCGDSRITARTAGAAEKHSRMLVNRPSSTANQHTATRTR